MPNGVEKRPFKDHGGCWEDKRCLRNLGWDKPWIRTHYLKCPTAHRWEYNPEWERFFFHICVSTFTHIISLISLIALCANQSRYYSQFTDREGEAWVRWSYGFCFILTTGFLGVHICFCFKFISFLVVQTFTWFRIQKIQVKVSLVSTLFSQVASYQFEPKPLTLSATGMPGLKNTTPLQIQENRMQAPNMYPHGTI